MGLGNSMSMGQARGKAKPVLVKRRKEVFTKAQQSAEERVLDAMVGKKASIAPLDYLYHELFTKIAASLNIPLKLKNRIIWRFGHGGMAKSRFSGRYEVVLWYTLSDDYKFNFGSNNSINLGWILDLRKMVTAKDQDFEVNSTGATYKQDDDFSPKILCDDDWTKYLSQ